MEVEHVRIHFVQNRSNYVSGGRVAFTVELPHILTRVETETMH